MNIWRQLNIKKTADVREIKRAYARQLKEFHAEDDPKRFQQLRAAYEEALSCAESDRSDERSLMLSAEEAATPDSPVYSELNRADMEKEEVPVYSDREISDETRGKADKLLDRVFGRLSQKDAIGASEELERIWRSEELHDLNLRQAFEEQMADRLARTEPLSFWLLDEAIGLFNWWEDYSHIGIEYAEIVVWLLARIEGRKKSQELREQGSTWLNSVLFTQRELAAFLLTGPYRPRMFLILSFVGGVFNSIKAIMQELGYFPAAMNYELDRDTVAWWQRKLEQKAPFWLRSVRFLSSWYWIPGALLTVLLIRFDIAPPQGFLVFFVFLCFLNMVTTLAPYFRPWIRPVQHSAEAWSGALLAFAVLMAISGSISEPPWNMVTGIIGFVLFMVFLRQDALAFFVGSLALWVVLRIIISAEVMPVVDPGVSLTFLWSEFALIALIKIWRLYHPYRKKKEKFDWQKWELDQKRNKMFNLE